MSSRDGPQPPFGAPFGSLEHINVHVRQAVDSSGELRQAILSVDHAPTEVVLIRQCAEVFKLTYNLRLSGDDVDHLLLTMFDSQLRVSPSLIGQLVAGHHGRSVRDLLWYSIRQEKRLHPPAPLLAIAGASRPRMETEVQRSHTPSNACTSSTSSSQGVLTMVCAPPSSRLTKRRAPGLSWFALVNSAIQMLITFGFGN